LRRRSRRRGRHFDPRGWAGWTNTGGGLVDHRPHFIYAHISLVEQAHQTAIRLVRGPGAQGGAPQHLPQKLDQIGLFILNHRQTNQLTAVLGHSHKHIIGVQNDAAKLNLETPQPPPSADHTADQRHQTLFLNRHSQVLAQSHP
jgi:hypothetical protein